MSNKEDNQMSLEDPLKIYKAMLKAGDNWSEANYEASLYEETKKTLHAKIVGEIMSTGLANGVKIAKTSAEIMAYADPRFEEHLEKMSKARANANKHRVRYDSLRVMVDVMRTLESTKRAELNSLGKTT